MAPFGRQWFSLQDRSPDAMLSGVRMAAPILNGFIDSELARAKVEDARLALVGFSQGTMMSLHVGLRRNTACAGVVGFSGLLIGPEELTSEIKSRMPVLLIHGEDDELIPARAMPAAAAMLKANHVPVTSELRPGLGHGIDERGIALAETFLAGILAP
jgi:phospholipase/carboxylesterase